MSESERIQRIIEPAVVALGYEVVRVQLSGGRTPTVQVMVERADRQGMGVEDCAEVSRAISPVLDVEDPIAGAWRLEVSSPGIDRPLTRMGDFDRFAGFEAKVETKTPIDGRRRFRGILRGVSGEQVSIEMPEGSAAVPFTEIVKAKLVLTDALIAAHS